MRRKKKDLATTLPSLVLLLLARASWSILISPLPRRAMFRATLPLRSRPVPSLVLYFVTLVRDRTSDFLPVSGHVYLFSFLSLSLSLLTYFYVVTESLGRKWALQINVFVFIIGAILMTVATGQLSLICTAACLKPTPNNEY